MRTRLVLSVVATTVGLAFWWALTEPLPVPPVILLGIPAAILFCAGLIAGRLGVLASPIALLFSLFVGSIIATQLHQYFSPSSAPISSFNAFIALSLPELLSPLAVAAALGLAGGYFGERLMPTAR
jgi:ABC-type transporter Mla maintaining outer membrane lipid asymmetry permease subunit MlaE